MSVEIEKLVLEFATLLTKHHLSCVTAESCTGGGLSYWLTSVPGSSTWFDRGFVTYSNQAKVDLLDVSLLTLDTHGAVSKETASDMATGALKNSQADVAITITGIAGPDGGTLEKPVGTVWIGLCEKGKNPISHYLKLDGTRQFIREETIKIALKLAISEICAKS